MSDSDKIMEPLESAEPNESYSEAQEENAEEADLPILVEDSDEEGEPMEMEDAKGDLKSGPTEKSALSDSPPSVILPKSAADLAKKLAS
ncbi:unnamed protein product, partial [Notodromas monacha]